MPLREAKRVASARHYGPVAPAPAPVPPHRPPRSASISTASARKPPEPLRRAVADCLSPHAPHTHPTAAAAAAEASRTLLRDYIANPSTIDMAYNVLIDHALAESDRSPAVVPRCVALLKRYLIRYIPRVQTLRQIDLFCANTIAKCEPMANRAASFGQNYTSAAAAPNSSPLAPPISNFASASLVKSLNYVRSLVARHIPKLSFQPIAPSVASKQSLPSLSSFLNRSLVSQLTPEVISNREHLESKECHSSSDLISSASEKVDGVEPSDDSKYISFDILSWRWHVYGERQASTSAKESGYFVGLQDFHTHGFLEVGAAALLVGDMDAKINDQQWKYSLIQEFPDIDLLQPSTSAPNSFASSQSHLKAITASKRMKSGPNQVWMNIPANTFQPRARPLFQYRPYSEQQPLRLNPAEISEVIAEVCLEASSNANQSIAPSRLSTQNRQPSADMAFSVLIKLVIDMYMMDSETAAPLTLYMLEGMLSSQKSSARTKALDLILNLGVHAHLLEPMVVEDASLIDKSETVNHPFMNNEYVSSIDEPRAEEPEEEQNISPAIDQFESWLLKILFDVLLLLVQMEERQEIVWASALSCLFYFVCDGGKIIRTRLGGLDIRVVKTLLEISVEHSWAKVVHSKLICMLTNMLYQVSDVTQNGVRDTHFDPERIDLLGGIDYICLEYSRANSREEKRDLFFVIFDYVVHQINEACLAGGIATYAYDDAQPLASLLAFADAPEAFYISVKHGVEGVGDMLRKELSAALSQSAQYDQLNVLLDKVMRKLDGTVSTFSRIDNEFAYMIQMCDMLFSQLCLRIPATYAMHVGVLQSLGQLFGCTTKNIDSHLETLASHQSVGNKNLCRSETLQDISTNQSAQSTLLCEASMAALLLRGLAIAPMQLVARVPTSLFFWPLIQLEGAASDDIALGIAVGSTGRGNLPGATSDIRAALLLLLIGKCTADQEALKEVEGNEFFRGLLDDTDSRVAYYSAAFLLKRMMTEEPEIYQRMLQSLISKAQQCNNEKLLENPYLQMRGILQLSNDLGEYAKYTKGFLAP
ncbi:hypothetical protein U9M48_016332 [Paspalum notatum var. saurae]|uniref:Uncharacterized protein n=1 Tax=Paspalum notatum var. saurae TaxID=547442 RepID=A0AAQ3T8H3_PASNO